MSSVTLLLAGDVMSGRGIDQILPHPSEPTLYEPHVRDARDYVRLVERAQGPVPRGVDAAYPWGDALDEMDRLRPDLRIVNLETAVTTHAVPWPGKGIHYRMHPDHVACLRAARLDVCTLANNHVLDWGREGLAQTLQVLQAAGIATAGAGADARAAWAPAVRPLPGGRRALVFACADERSGVSPAWAAGPGRGGLALLAGLGDAAADALAAAIARARRALAHGPGEGPVLLSIHWGDNWVEQVPEAHRRFAHRLVDLAAVDVVQGHSSHHPLPAEVYRDHLILYGCGDLMNDYAGIGAHGRLRSDVGVLYAATLDAGSGRLQALALVPLQSKRLRLERADDAARAWLAGLLSQGGRPLGTSLAAAPGGWTLQWERRAAPMGRP